MADVGSETIDLAGLLTGKTYTITITPVSGPTEMTFNPSTNTAIWTPTAADVNTGYTTTDALFRVTNSVGPVEIAIPIRVLFSGSVSGTAAYRNGYTASATWAPPTDNVTPVVSCKLTRYWTFAGSHKASATYTVPGYATSFDFTLGPTGAVNHTGITIAPVDQFGNLGVSTQKIAFGSFQNDLPPIATDDTYSATEDTQLVTSAVDGVRANDVDTDNTPGISVLKAQLVSTTSNGTLALAANGSFTYTPAAEFHGTDTFVYRTFDGKLLSDYATVTINVSAVNDTPLAQDDDYSVAQDTTLNLDATTGVQANDSDVDGDTLTTSIVSSPTNGSIVLAGDGSFSYTPNAGFTGTDTFSYLANDTLLDSRVSSVSITVIPTTPPPPPGTRFYVVDFDGRATFEYDTNGGPVETYGLPNANRKPLGVTANADGSLVWTLDKQKRVFIYDDAGTQLGMWVPEGLSKPEGIATDGTNIWIVDRGSDSILYYADGALRRNGSFPATSHFALERANRNPKGITSDGTHLWVVNDARLNDKVFRYNVDGTPEGSWSIDATNTQPTGVTIDPSDVNHVWVVDARSDSVYQYDGAADRLSGQQDASSFFQLAPSNRNPQGIADPPTRSVSVDDGGWESRNPSQPAAISTWENISNSLDTNDDGNVSPLDALLVINHLASEGSTNVIDLDVDAAFLDTSADGLVSPLDILVVLNGLSEQSQGVEARVVDSAISQLIQDDDEEDWLSASVDQDSSLTSNRWNLL